MAADNISLGACLDVNAHLRSHAQVLSLQLTIR